MPHVEVRSRRVGGATFQIPMQIRPDRKVSMAMKWLIGYARKRNEKSMAQKLAAEIIAASKRRRCCREEKNGYAPYGLKLTKHSHTLDFN